MGDTFLLWKTAHVLSAAVLFGSGLGTAFLCWFGYRAAVVRGDIAALRNTLSLTVLADLWLTTPAVFFQAASGIVMMFMLQWSLTSLWSMVVWAMFLVIGACWLPVVAMQVRLRNMAAVAASMQALPREFHRTFRAWFALGVPAFTITVMLFYLMVAKPLPVQ
jgi:uncharacterized membrane protein